jgi:hypothetical protein
MVSEGKPEHPLHHRRPPFNRRQLLMQAVVAVVILASGIGIGTGGTILALKNRLVPRLRLPPPSPPGMEPNVLVERWKGDYGLSDKQSQQTKDTLTKQFAATRDLWENFRQAEQSEREKFAASMKKILTPEQFTKWDNDLKERMEHFRGMRPFEGRGGGRGGPRGERRPDRSMDPNDHRRDGPPRPLMGPDGRRGGWTPRGPMDSNSRRGNWSRRDLMDPNDRYRDRPAPDRPMELNSRPGDVNGPK